MLGKIFKHADDIKKGLDAAWLRNEVLANNIANVDTPGFKRSDVDFKAILENEQSSSINMKTTRAQHFQNSNFHNYETTVYEDNKTTMRMDGNNVDIEYEAAELAKNTIWYNYLVQKISKEFSRIKKSINEIR